MSVDRTHLPRTFGPWFTRFQGLTAVQQQAIPPIVAGHDVLLCSATASGKTEAYAAPAAERAAARNNAPATVLILSPTRALANDLKRRLEGPMSLVGVTFGRYTGEHKERSAGGLCAVTVLTPEALDSLLTRRASALRQTCMVVIDEVHVIDGTPRGDHLRVLLHRLTLTSQHPIQRVAVSATVDDPEALAARYLSADHVQVIVPGSRRLLGRAFDKRTPEALREHLNTLADAGLRKILIFCRSRNQVETLSSKLKGHTRFGDAVFAHHGSLAQIQRERTERQFLAATAGICFATLTLEMGIDIGTVDYVLLADVPSDVASLLQRIGRGGRRGDTTRFGFITDNAAELHILQTLVALAKEGRFAGRPYGFRPSVFVQQALTTACAGSYIEPPDIDRLIPPDIAPLLGPAFSARLLEAMLEASLLERAGPGRFVATEAIERRFERGELHGNIDEAPSEEVVDRLTGDVVGHLEGVNSRRIEFGGRDRSIVARRGGRILTDAGRDGLPARFRSSGSPSVSLRQGRAMVEALGVPDHAIVLVRCDGELRALHGLGTLGELLFLAALERAGVSSGASNAYATVLGGSLESVPLPTEDDIEDLVRKRAGSLARLTQAGPWRKGLPEDVHLRALRQMAGLDEAAAWLRGARVVAWEEPPALCSTVLPLL
ncbi:MAG: DEAD/DEAH box helicase [Planctomycetota bacterium]